MSDQPDNPITAEYLQALGAGFNEVIPHNADIGMVTEKVATDHVVTRLPYREDWLAEPAYGLINTGLITSIADSSCGLMVLAAIGGGERIATLDLRVDYLRSAMAGEDIYCRAQVTRQTRRIVFTEATVYQQEGEPVAKVAASFMRTGRKRITAPPNRNRDTAATATRAGGQQKSSWEDK